MTVKEALEKYGMNGPIVVQQAGATWVVYQDQLSYYDLHNTLGADKITKNFCFSPNKCHGEDVVDWFESPPTMDGLAAWLPDYSKALRAGDVYPAHVPKCTCDIVLIMRVGCECGGK